MKLSKTAQWILTIGILLALLVTIGVVYMQRRADHNELNSQLTNITQGLVTNSREKQELESQLSQAGLALSRLEEKALFPAPTQAAEIEQGLLWVASKSGATITSLSCLAPQVEQQGGITYQVFYIDLTVVGKQEALLTFSNTLGYWFPSASIEGGVMPVFAEGKETLLTLALKIYTR